MRKLTAKYVDNNAYFSGTKIELPPIKVKPEAAEAYGQLNPVIQDQSAAD